jgi:oligoribonuclease
MTGASKPPTAPNLVWIDLEMTGLDPVGCHIMEIGCLVTDGDLDLVAEGPDLIIHNSEEQLTTLSQWCLDHFGRGDFIDRVRASEVSLRAAEEQVLAFLQEHTGPGESPLCGNSVHHDREFLRHHMPQLHEYLHYRNIDVSTVKQLVNRWYPGQVSPPPKAEHHRAMADIRESLLELRYYRSRFFR